MFYRLKEMLKRFLPMPAKRVHEQNQYLNEKIKLIEENSRAAGYPFLYILYRVLRDAKPKRILELGLGETTKLISQYAAANEDVEHFVVEHDLDWISFYKKEFSLPANSMEVNP